jgi:hypothetical protein
MKPEMKNASKLVDSYLSSVHPVAKKGEILDPEIEQSKDDKIYSGRSQLNRLISTIG